jgi:6,7-dimethyl-8-ribityllumazine synthase
MSGGSAPHLNLKAEGLRACIIAAQWHEVVMGGLIGGATRACDQAGSTHELIRVPGAFELPLAAQFAARSGRFDALIALGVVIRGGTPHFEYVCSVATQGLLRVGLDTQMPIGFGLLTVDSEQEALDRAGFANSPQDKGSEAVEAALAMALLARDTFTLAGSSTATEFR